nr:FliH/SctL family protein [uncultured Desulfuromonas sp.]
MSSSKILRDAKVKCQCVAMADLSEVVQAQKGSFTVTECPQESVVIPTEALSAGQPSAPVEVAPAIDIEAIRQEGYVEGKQAGLDEANAQLSKATKALAEACRQLSGQRQKMLDGSREDMLRIVLVIAEKVVLAELSAHREAINRTIQQAIQAAVSAEEFHIKINPEDMEVVQEHKPLFIASLTGLTNIEFVADPSVTAGGCILESPVGRVDATIEAQMEEITQALREAVSGE